MKRISILCAGLTLLTLVSSCKKDQETVTLGAVIDQNAKVYVDDHLPSWENGDQIVINDGTYAITVAAGANGQINNVAAALSYRAIYPASLVAAGSNIASSPSVPVTLPSTQTYSVVGGHQHCELPMGAYLTSGNTLLFHNLCSVVRVTVNNQTNDALAITSITIASENAILSGDGTATIAGQADDAIVMSATGSHEVTLAKSDNTVMETLPVANGTAVFDIVVPAFATPDNVTITVNTADGYQEFAKTNVTLVNNTVTTVTANMNSLTPYMFAYLVDGPIFNAALPTAATAVRFEYNNTSVTSGTLLSTANSPNPIYGNLASDGTWVVSTSASTIFANADCSWMFAGTWGEWSIVSNLTSIDFGNGFNTSRVASMNGMFYGCWQLTSCDPSIFNTSNVTDMSYMFSYCGLTSLNLSSFNTPNVIDMSHMFECCRHLTSLNVSSFSTSNVTNMESMFAACENLATLNVSNFNTSRVTNMESMFSSCSTLTSLDLSHFNTSRVTDMFGIFQRCSSLTSIDVSNFNTSCVTDMRRMFEGCSSLTTLDLSCFNTSNVIDMSWMFDGCSGLTSLNLYNFSLGYYYYMCNNLATASGACTITCPMAIKFTLMYSTNLPTSGVSYTWITH
ncbi:MAG: BspA family leucine-rich repeat surface protein [Bacteroidales bacterium]|nr:BspA family leucine-rich repeat surface protein [Bacteroidales bacterium]